MGQGIGLQYQQETQRASLALWAILLHSVLLASIQIECLRKSSLPLVTTIESELCIPRTKSGSGWFRLGPEPLTVLPQGQNSLIGKGAGVGYP